MQRQSLIVTYSDQALRSLVVKLVLYYRYYLSPLLGPKCRFTPSCSTYCLEAIELHGLFYGISLTIRRLLRCHSLTPCGWDPVPTK